MKKTEGNPDRLMWYAMPLVLLVALLLSSCMVTVPVAATTGGIDADYSYKQPGTTIGASSCLFILGIGVRGDCSILRAARNGGINYVATVDQTIRHRGLWSVRTTIVTGRASVKSKEDPRP